MDIIVGIIGVEIVYGCNIGNFCVMDVLIMLVFDYFNIFNCDVCMVFFWGELENILLLVCEVGIDLMFLCGFYVGVIGWLQFMLGSICEYVVDFDGDGKIDLCNLLVDVIGSVVYYLVVYGWQCGELVVFLVMVLNDNCQWEVMFNQGLEVKYIVEEL